ncbi:MAG: type II toxin-antitoxin system VapC family toxin [bacterium]
MDEIFIDTWAWCALTNKKDRGHSFARKLNRKLIEQNYRYITTNFVLDESYTLIRARIGYRAAVKFGQKIKELRKQELLGHIVISEGIEEKAWDFFVKYQDIDDLSYTDCTSFAVMKKLGLREVFTGDDHFQYVGFIKKEV